MSELKLIKAARKYNKAAQADLYRLYNRHWFMICLRYNKDRFDAEDCLHNALVKIFSNIHQFDENRGSFKDWTSRVVINENLIFLRERKKRRSADVPSIPAELPEHGPDDKALSSEKLTQLIQSLPEGYRNVFNLFVMEGYDHQEIAAILDISVGTSKSQLFKARKMLQKQIEVLL